MKLLLKIVIANVAIVICTVVGALSPGLWPGLSGRDFRPQATNAGTLILVVSCVLRYRFKWTNLQMLICMVPTQFIILLCIAHFSGFAGTELLDAFNLGWLWYLDLFICVPWMIGMFIGSIVLREKASKRSA